MNTLPATGTRRSRLWPDAAIVVLTLAVFGQVAGFEFVNFDDTQFITENPGVRGGLSVASLRYNPDDPVTRQLFERLEAAVTRAPSPSPH